MIFPPYLPFRVVTLLRLSSYVVVNAVLCAVRAQRLDQWRGNKLNEFQNQIQNLDVGEFHAQQLVPSQQGEVYSNDARLCVGLGLGGFGIGGCFGCFSCFGCGGCGGCARCGGCGGCARCAGCGGCARCAGCARCGGCGRCGRCGGR